MVRRTAKQQTQEALREANQIGMESMNAYHAFCKVFLNTSNKSKIKQGIKVREKYENSENRKIHTELEKDFA